MRRNWRRPVEEDPMPLLEFDGPRPAKPKLPSRYGDENRQPRTTTPRYGDENRQPRTISAAPVPRVAAAKVSAPTVVRYNTAPVAPATKLPAYKQQAYAKTPAALSASEVAEFDARRRAATRSFQDALNQQQAGTQAAELSYKQAKSSIGRAAVDNEIDAREGYAAQGLAFAPKYLGKALVRVRDQRLGELNNAGAQKAGRLAELAAIANSAKNTREAEIAAIAAEKAARQAELNRLVRGTGV